MLPAVELPVWVGGKRSFDVDGYQNRHQRHRHQPPQHRPPANTTMLSVGLWLGERDLPPPPLPPKCCGVFACASGRWSFVSSGSGVRRGASRSLRRRPQGRWAKQTPLGSRRCLRGALSNVNKPLQSQIACDKLCPSRFFRRQYERKGGIRQDGERQPQAWWTFTACGKLRIGVCGDQLTRRRSVDRDCMWRQVVP